MSKKTILIVDDHPAWYDFLCCGLRHDPEWVVDIKLWGDDGLDLCQAVKELNLSIPSLVISAYDLEILYQNIA